MHRRFFTLMLLTTFFSIKSWPQNLCADLFASSQKFVLGESLPEFTDFGGSITAPLDRPVEDEMVRFIKTIRANGFPELQLTHRGSQILIFGIGKISLKKFLDLKKRPVSDNKIKFSNYELHFHSSLEFLTISLGHDRELLSVDPTGSSIFKVYAIEGAQTLELITEQVSEFSREFFRFEVFVGNPPSGTILGDPVPDGELDLISDPSKTWTITDEKQPFETGKNSYLVSLLTTATFDSRHQSHGSSIEKILGRMGFTEIGTSTNQPALRNKISMGGEPILFQAMPGGLRMVGENSEFWPIRIPGNYAPTYRVFLGQRGVIRIITRIGPHFNFSVFQLTNNFKKKGGV